MGRDDSGLKGRMIFVVGARRSGTNWLQRVVASHPLTASVPSETALFSRGIKPLRERFHHGVLASPGTGFVYMDHEMMLDALRDFCDRVFERFLSDAPGAEYLIERTPEHVECLELIGDIYPDACVLHIIRDGRDVARSLLSADWGPTSIAQAAEEWRSAISSARAAAGGLKRYHEIRYEDLLADPVRGVGDIFEWLGIGLDERLLKQGIDEANVVFNVDPRSRRVAVGKWRESFTEADLAEFNRIAGSTLRELGYDAPTAESSPGHGRDAAPARAPKRGLLASLIRGGGDQSALPREINARMIHAQRSLDRLLSLIAQGRLAEIRGALSHEVEVRIIRPRAVWQGRGAEAADRLLTALAEETGQRGRQVSGTIHLGVPTSAAVMTFEFPDGSHEVRILFVSVDGSVVSQVTYYRLPLASR